MDFRLKPLTEPGRRFAALAEEHAADFTTRADQHDRDGSFPFENIEAMQRSGCLAACVPAELGGLGVDSVHDLTIAMNRLGYGDGSTAIATNMHTTVAFIYARQWRAALAQGNATQAAALEERLRQIRAGSLIVCIVNSEAGTDLAHPYTEGVRVENGWILNGRKMFGTLSPAATLVLTTLRIRDDDGGYLRGLASIPRGTPGLEILDNWDALGMRASGSGDIVFKDCFVPETAVTIACAWGKSDEGLQVFRVVALAGLVGAFLGIAEAAQDHVVDLVKTRRRLPSGRTLAELPAIQHTIAENEIDLAAARAMLARDALLQDAYLRDTPAGSARLPDLHHLMKNVQCTKWFVTRKAVEIVDRALTASGGAGYLTKSPLARLYRDVRAGPFMQPYSPNEQFEFIGKVTLGIDPEAES